MKKYFFMAMLTCIMSSITSCSNNKSNKDENGIDSAAIVQAKADSIARIDSIARADSIAHADSIARADSIAKANNLVVGMKVSDALQKTGVKKACIDDFDGMHEGEKLILIQNGKKFLTNVSYHMKNGFAECDHLNFTLLPDSYEGDITLVRAKDCTASAKIVKEIK